MVTQLICISKVVFSKATIKMFLEKIKIKIAKTRAEAFLKKSGLNQLSNYLLMF